MQNSKKEILIQNFLSEELENRLEFKKWVTLPEPCLCADCDCNTKSSIFDIGFE